MASAEEDPSTRRGPFKPCRQAILRLRYVFSSRKVFTCQSFTIIVATPVAGSFVRISDSPLSEWHSFATIAEPGKRGFSSVVSLAGDWTSKKIENPPSEIWVRGIPTTGFIHVAPLFRRVVLVATGSGIGPCVPCILEQRVPIRLLWTSPNVRQTFGDELVDTIVEKSPDAVIYGKISLTEVSYLY